MNRIAYDEALKVAQLLGWLLIDSPTLVVTYSGRRVDIEIPASVPHRKDALHEAARSRGKLPIYCGDKARFMKGEWTFYDTFDDLPFRVSCPWDQESVRVRHVHPQDVAGAV